MDIKTIVNLLEQKAPSHTAEEWDNVGLLVDVGSEVTGVVTALDATPEAIAFVKEKGANLLVTHHPVIFQAPKSITDDDGVGRALLQLIRSNISAINAHTNLDCAPGGVNDVLAAKVGLADAAVLNPSGLDAEGRPWGLLRHGTVAECTLASFLEQVKRALGCDGLRYVDGGKPVRHVAVGGGSCAGALRDVADAGCDTFVTADVRYNQFWDAKELGINLIDATHFATENPVVAVLAGKLRAAFPDVAVKISENHRDCMKFY
jgi:dinuclear metal center YbgI/SA1388 family protein